MRGTADACVCFKGLRRPCACELTIRFSGEDLLGWLIPFMAGTTRACWVLDDVRLLRRCAGTGGVLPEVLSGR